MKKIALPLAIMAVLFSFSTLAFAAADGTKPAVSSDVKDEKCEEVTSPCLWRHEFDEGATMVAVPRIPYRQESDRAMFETFTQRRARVLDERTGFVDSVPAKYRKKAGACAVLCFVSIGFNIEAKKLADKYGYADEKGRVKRLAEIETELAQSMARHADADRRFDSGAMKAEVELAGKLTVEQNKLMASFGQIGSCELKDNPWHCFKVQAKWSEAYAWAKNVMLTKDKSYEGLVQEAAANICLQQAASYNSTVAKDMKPQMNQLVAQLRLVDPSVTNYVSVGIGEDGKLHCVPNHNPSK